MPGSKLFILRALPTRPIAKKPIAQKPIVEQLDRASFAPQPQPKIAASLLRFRDYKGIGVILEKNPVMCLSKINMADLESMEDVLRQLNARKNISRNAMLMALLLTGLLFQNPDEDDEYRLRESIRKATMQHSSMKNDPATIFMLFGAVCGSLSFTAVSTYLEGLKVFRTESPVKVLAAFVITVSLVAYFYNLSRHVNLAMALHDLKRSLVERALSERPVQELQQAPEAEAKSRKSTKKRV